MKAKVKDSLSSHLRAGHFDFLQLFYETKLRKSSYTAEKLSFTLADSDSRLKVKFYSCKVRLRTVKPGALVSRKFEFERKGN